MMAILTVLLAFLGAPAAVSSDLKAALVILAAVLVMLAALAVLFRVALDRAVTSPSLVSYWGHRGWRRSRW